MARKPAAKRKRKPPKLTDADRRARFVEMAREVEAADDPKALDRLFKKVVKQRPQTRD